MVAPDNGGGSTVLPRPDIRCRGRVLVAAAAIVAVVAGAQIGGDTGIALMVAGILAILGAWPQLLAGIAFVILLSIRISTGAWILGAIGALLCGCDPDP